MGKAFSFEVATELAADKQAVLTHATSMRGVNRELGPLVRMTAPRAYRDRTLFDAPVGQPLFRSWVVLAWVLPVDFDHLCFESIDPDSGFVESSTMLSIASWRHERRVLARGAASRLVDRVTFTPRIPGTGPLLVRIAKALFRHRHARLAALFGPRARDRASHLAVAEASEA